jgi:hypothetical protein|tara:strand:+ start:564 stop:920 length:357 start_codon:yes stop_codon:yes gene_type:complete
MISQIDFYYLYYNKPYTMSFNNTQTLSSFGFKFTSPDYIKTSKSWTFVDPRFGNPTIDINTWNTITSDKYITTIKNTRPRSNTNQDTIDTTNIRKLQKLNKIITNKIKRNRLNKYSNF